MEGAEEKEVSRRAVEIRESLWEANPEQVRMGPGVASALQQPGSILNGPGSDCRS